MKATNPFVTKRDFGKIKCLIIQYIS